MIYNFTITTDLNTTYANRKLTRIVLAPGIVHRLEILFPPGPAGLLHVLITDGLHQVWPTNPDEDFASDDEVVAFNEYYEMRRRPFELQVYTWNLDDSYNHTLILRIGVLPRKQLLRRFI